MSGPRYYVLYVSGWLTPGRGRWGGDTAIPGLSATVMDGLTGMEVVTFRSEEVSWVPGGRHGRRGEASRLAKAKAAELNRSTR